MSLICIYFRGTHVNLQPKTPQYLFLMSRETICIKILKMTHLWASAVAHTIK